MAGEKLVLLFALGWDMLLGDPRSAYHPVVLIGRCITFGERRLLVAHHSPHRKMIAGALLVLLVLSITYSLVWMLDQVLSSLHPAVSLLIGSLFLSFTISPRSLAQSGNEIKDYLLAGNLDMARYKVGWIVGRDTNRLDSAEITRATVETVAENIVDGIIAPMFYAAIGGLPLAFMYRAVNTLDSMIGYKNDRYLYFGRVAARTDDLFNYIPARITGLLLIIAAFILKFDAFQAAQMIWRDASKHPSPNSGIPEAGVAGALGIRLGGMNYYGGVPSFRAYMGDPVYKIVPVLITDTVKLMYGVTILFVLLITIVLFLAS